MTDPVITDLGGGKSFTWHPSAGARGIIRCLGARLLGRSPGASFDGADIEAILETEIRSVLPYLRVSAWAGFVFEGRPVPLDLGVLGDCLDELSEADGIRVRLEIAGWLFNQSAMREAMAEVKPEDPTATPPDGPSKSDSSPGPAATPEPCPAPTDPPPAS